MLSRFIRLPRFIIRRSFSSNEKPGALKSEKPTEIPSQTELIPLADDQSSEPQLVVTQSADSCATQKPRIDFKDLKHESKIPANPVKYCFDDKSYKGCAEQKVDKDTLQLLERLSLVSLESKEALQNLEESLEFAEKVLEITTTGVQPMHSVLEDCALKTRPDEVTDGNIKDLILSNASVTEEDYFVAPPGNIPVEQKEKDFH